jgi:hypothetical protein
MAKSLHFRTHHLLNSTTELTLMYITSILEAGVDPRGSTGVKFGSMRVFKIWGQTLPA